MFDPNLSENRPKKRVTFNTSSNESYISREAYKALRTNLLFCGKDIKTIVFTSTYSGEGKSTISSELAKSLSDSGKRTLLIDADMRKSVFLTANQRTGEVKGISELLSGISELDDVLYSTQEENFDVIFTGHFPPNPVELLGSDRFVELMHVFKERYDYVLIDAPPLAPVIDAAVIAQSVDAAIIIISPTKARRKEIIKAKEQLEKSGTRILGAVINEIEKSSGRSKKRRKDRYYYY